MSAFIISDPIARILSDASLLLENAELISACRRKKVLRRYQQDTYATIAQDERFANNACLTPTPHRDAQGNVQGKIVLRMRQDALQPASLHVYTEVARFLSLSDIYSVKGQTMARMVGVCEEQYIWKHDHYEKKCNRRLQLLNDNANDLLARMLYALMEEKVSLSSLKSSFGAIRAYLHHDADALAREMRRLCL